MESPDQFIDGDLINYLFTGAIIVFVAFLIHLLFTKKKITNKSAIVQYNPSQVSDYYNANTTKFIAVYGQVIQAFRTNNVDDYLSYTMQSARFGNGMLLLDAGCGVCGPAIHFAKIDPSIHIEACTISAVQAEMARENIARNNLENRIQVKEYDYHNIHKIYPNNNFDRVYFLESFGHSNDKKKLLHAAWDVLKPGGMVYIKDLFRREVENEWEQLRINHICGQINEAYCYHIPDLADILSILRKKGYILHFVKIPEVETSKFENLSISNDFQNLFNIGKIESWDDYVFPIDFFEILAEKPIIPSEEDMHLYFMNKKK